MQRQEEGKSFTQSRKGVPAKDGEECKRDYGISCKIHTSFSVS